jgi:hypothetical protein
MGVADADALAQVVVTASRVQVFAGIVAHA